MKALCISAVLVLVAVAAFAQGIIRGNVIDEQYGDPLIGANVLIEGTTQGATTDLDGNYSIEGLEPGTYKLVCSYISYQNKTITGIEVKNGEVTVVDFRMGTSEVQVNEVVIEAKRVYNTEAALLTVQKKAPVILDGISSAQISRNGDSDAAAAIKRVTGVSVEGGKYVYVRGLGDRYSKTLLNGAEVPGLDPNRNTVQMDLFPTNLLDNIIVYKTFSPDLPGSFTGGLVDVKTKDFPTKLTLQVSSSFGFNTQSSFNRNFLTHEGGNTDWAGIDDGTRDVPEFVQNNGIPIYQLNMPEGEFQQLQDATGAFNNTIDLERDAPFMNHSHSFSLGNQSKVFKKPLGYLLGISYSRSYMYNEGGQVGRYELVEDESVASALNSNLELDDDRSTEEVLWGAMFNTNYRVTKNSKIGLTALYNQSGVKGSRYQEGRKLADDPDLRYQTRSLTFRERSIMSFQLKGEHNIPNWNDVTIDWVSSYTVSKQNEPDLRFFTNGFRVLNGDTTYRIEPSIGQLPTRYYREMKEGNFDNKLNITIPFEQWNGEKAKFKTGVSYVWKQRDFREEQYRYDSQSHRFSGDPTQYVSNVWDGVTFADSSNNGVYMQDAFDPRNSYDASEKTLGAYGMVDLPITGNFRVITGARVEWSQIRTESFAETLPVGKLNNIDVLPSVNLNYAINENMNLRGSYSRTLARPTFRELAPYASFDFIGDFILIGSDSLQRTLVDNVDIRWEMFPGRGEIVSVSAFFKNFNNPIERAFNPLAANPELNYRNVDNAWLVGAEFEVRKNFGFISEAMEDLLIGANFTYVYSRVDIADDELANIRALSPSAESYRVMFGQSPYIINSFVSYDNEEWGTQLNLGFNIFGERLAVVIPNGTPNVFEQPRPSLNFSYKQAIGDNWRLNFSANNLLNPEYKMTQRFKGVDYVYESYTRGITFSIGATYSIN